MGKPKMPKNMQFDPIEMIEKNAEVNRIDQENQYGSSRYVTNPDGTQTFVTEFNDDLKGIHEDQLELVKQGSIKDPLGHLGEQGGGAMGDLMGAMFGKVKDRYMDGRENNIGKGGSSTEPPATETPAAPAEMSTAQKVRELQEKRKLAAEMAGTAQQAPNTMATDQIPPV